MPSPKPTASPHVSAASPVQRIWAHTRLEARTLLTNGEQLLVALILPALVFLGVLHLPLPPALGGATENPLLHAVASTAVTAVIATSMTSQAISTGFDRRAGVLRWIATTPLGRSGYLAGKLLALGIIHVLQVVVLGALAVANGWHPSFSVLAMCFPLWLLGAAAFGAAGLWLAGTLRAEAVLALSNIVFILLVALGGVAIPTAALPAWVAPVVSVLPSAALMSTLSAAVHGHVPPLLPVLILAGWGVLFAWLTAKFFKWTSA